jgi:hypothetical protein
MDNRFGSSFHVGPSPSDSTKPVSRIFEGMTATMSAATQANTRIVTICHTSQDDTSDNELTPNIAVTQAGLRGRLIQNGIGTSNSLSGGNSASALADASYRPMYASSIRSVTGALSYGTILSAYPAVYREKLANAISNLSQSQATRFSQLSLADQFQTLVNCGYITNKNYATTTPDIDPRTNAAMQAVYGLTATQVDGRSRNAAIVYNTLMGNSGPGVISIGGCDYHGEAVPGASGHGDFKDLEIGSEIGRAVEAAARLAKPLFIAVYSDGSVYSQDNTRVWNGDAGSKSLAFMVYYRPTGAPAIRKQQVGYFSNSGQSANTTPFWTKNTKFTSYVMIANYLNVCGQRSLFSSIAPSGFDTSTATIDSILGFG